MDRLLQSKIISECLNLAQKIAEFKQHWRVQANTKKDFYASLKTTTIITSAGSSTRIEGATLTDAEIQKKLVGLKIQKIKDRDDAEVAGYIDCKNYIFENYQSLSITEHTLRSLHQMMMQYLTENDFPHSQKGTYKNIANSVVRVDANASTQEIIFATTPPGPQTETAMRDLFLTYNHFIADSRHSDLQVIAAFVVKFLAIHPFRDGNGRMSRLITDLLLLKQGYEFCMYSSHEKIIEDHKVQYYISLRQTQASLTAEADLNPWLLFFLKTLVKQTEFLASKMPNIKLGTHTQNEELVIKVIQNFKSVSIGFLERETQIKRPTLKAILRRLQDNNTIKMVGERKTSRYSLL